MLLRRQAHYVASFDDSTETSEWLADMQRSESRRLRWHGDWSPSWAVVRSGAHSLARKGDREALQEFISRSMRTDRCETANLNYWAYWLGEITELQTADTFMVEVPTRSWRGAKLLRHLIGKLSPDNVYIDVVAHTVWALLQDRPAVVHDEPGMLGRLRQCAVQALDARGIPPRCHAVSSKKSSTVFLWPTAVEREVSIVHELKRLTGFLYEIGLLKRYRRTGWLVAGIKDPESIADHSHRTAVIASVLAAMEGANPERAALLSVFHDTQETRLTDIPYLARRYVR